MAENKNMSGAEIVQYFKDLYSKSKPDGGNDDPEPGAVIDSTPEELPENRKEEEERVM